MRPSRIILALLPLAFAAPAMAQGTPEQRAACGPDAFRLCAATIPNVDRTAACLRTNRERLSAACRTVMDTNDGGGSKVAQTPPAPKAPRTAAKPEPAPRLAQRAAPARQRVVERATIVPRAAGRAGATRAATRTVAAHAPTPRRAASRAAIRQAAVKHRPYDGRRGRGGSEMAQAMYWLRTVSGYANAIGNGATLGSLGRI